MVYAVVCREFEEIFQSSPVCTLWCVVETLSFVKSSLVWAIIVNTVMYLVHTLSKFPLCVGTAMSKWIK